MTKLGAFECDRQESGRIELDSECSWPPTPAGFSFVGKMKSASVESKTEIENKFTN